MKKLPAEEYYNKLASIYDQATKNAWAAPEHVHAVTGSLANKNLSVLDIGIGTGQSIQNLYDTAMYGHMEGIDISDEMLALCRDKYPLITLHQGDFSGNIGLEKESYDLIVCCGALEFIESLDNFFSKCKKLLAKNGNLVLTYEPIIYGHEIQSKPTSETKSERLSSVEGFITYRHDIDQFNSVARKYGFSAVKENLFISYKKLDKEIVYMLVHFKN